MNIFTALISQVDMAALVHMSDDDLKAMGIPMVSTSYLAFLVYFTCASSCLLNVSDISLVMFFHLFSCLYKCERIL